MSRLRSTTTIDRMYEHLSKIDGKGGLTVDGMYKLCSFRLDRTAQSSVKVPVTLSSI